MAYFRGDNYIWSDGERLHLWAANGYDAWDETIWACGDEDARRPGYENAAGVSVAESVINEFVVMRFAQMLADGSVFDAIDRAAHVGNFGGMTLAKNADTLKAALAQIKIKPWRHGEPTPPVLPVLEENA